jgi:hypothetical protein
MPFDALGEELLRAGVAPRHVRRYLRELTDHLADLTEAQRAAGHGEEDARLRARALLGGNGELAAAMLAEPRLRSWAARAPWLVFGLLPPLTIVAAFAALILPLVAIANFDHMALHLGAPVWFQRLAQGTAFAANLTLTPALALTLVWLAGRQRLSRIWPLLGIAVLLVLSVHMTTHFPAPDPQSGQIGLARVHKTTGPYGGQIGLAIVPISSMLRVEMRPELPLFLAQMLLTLLPALALLRLPLVARAGEPD